MVNITAAFENEKAQAIVQSRRRTTTRKKRIVRQFPRQPESAEDIRAMVQGRRRLAACDTSTWKFADDASLSGSGGWNILSASCTLGHLGTNNHFEVPSGKTLKIKKDPTMAEELVIDRQATQSNQGRHFQVAGTLNVEGVTLTGGYVSAIDCIFEFLRSLFFFKVWFSDIESSFECFWWWWLLLLLSRRLTIDDHTGRK